jgi:hypothetical protein
VRHALVQQHGLNGFMDWLEVGAFPAMVRVELMNQALLPPVLETNEGVYRCTAKPSTCQ